MTDTKDMRCIAKPLDSARWGLLGVLLLVLPSRASRALELHGIGAASELIEPTVLPVKPVENEFDADRWLNSDQKRRLLLLTSIFENGKPELDYGYIQNLDDGRGYTAGSVGFCTGTSDLIQVVRRYTELRAGNVLAKYLPTLAKVDGTDSVKGLEGFEVDWKLAAHDPFFRQAQNEIANKLYYLPAMKKADRLGLKMPFSRAILYDTIVMHGDGQDPDGLDALIKRTTKKMKSTPGNGTSERAWMKVFLDEREKTLKNPADKSTFWEWSGNSVRAEILRDMLMSGEFDQLNHPTKLDNVYYKGPLP